MIAHSLFHFTSQFDTIKKILKSKCFKSSYCLEDVKDLYPNEKFAAIPMVCFCDIPLKFISNEHTKRYGYFGIGLTKHWGIKNKINPVMYRLTNCLTQQSYFDIVNSILVNIEKLNELLLTAPVGKNEYVLNMLENESSSLEKALYLAAHIKTYDEEKGNKLTLNYIDREWRWVPFDEYSEKPRIYFCQEESMLQKIKSSEETEKINFDYGDIKYIVVRRTKDILRAIDFIHTMNLDDNEKYLLIQKIIDVDGINKNM